MSNGYVCSAISGIEGMPVSMAIIPLLDGTAIPNLYIPQPGTINVTILVGMPANSSNEMDYYNLLDRIPRAFYNSRNSAPAPGYLQIQRPDGTVRQIAVYATSGFNTPEVGINDITVYTFTFETPDPYWYDSNVQSIIYQQNISSGILPLLPIQFSAGTVFGSNTIINLGSATTYPTWTITGPGTPTMTNLTTNLKWSLNNPIPAGNVAQVVCKPGSQMAVNTTTGQSIWDTLVYSSLRQLWGLVPGPNLINISMAGSTPATQVRLDWSNRWSRA
jgi:hypothetical protein